LDSSAALALMNPGHALRGAVAERVRGFRLGLAGHAAYETYSVLTRWPPPHRISAAVAQRVIEANFPATRHLDADHSSSALAVLATAGVAARAVVDGLVALAARADDQLLITCDQRALSTYRALGVRLEILT
jgi:hypothetical protein